MHDAAASFPILHAMFFSLPLLLLTKMPIPQGVDETHLEAMSTEYEYYDYEGIPIQVLHTIQKANIRQIFNSHYCIFTIFFPVGKVQNQSILWFLAKTGLPCNQKFVLLSID